MTYYKKFGLLNALDGYFPLSRLEYSKLKLKSQIDLDPKFNLLLSLINERKRHYIHSNIGYQNCFLERAIY